MNEELKYLDLLKGSNLSRDKSRLRKEIKGTSATDVQAYAEEQDIPYSQAYKELSTYGLGTLIFTFGVGPSYQFFKHRVWPGWPESTGRFIYRR